MKIVLLSIIMFSSSILFAMDYETKMKDLHYRMDFVWNPGDEKNSFKSEHLTQALNWMKTERIDLDQAQAYNFENKAKNISSKEYDNYRTVLLLEYIKNHKTLETLPAQVQKHEICAYAHNLFHKTGADLTKEVERER